MAELLFKVTGEDGEALMGTGSWRLPGDDGQPGEWMPPIEGDLEPCTNGYHLARPSDLIHWLGPVIWVAEARGERVESDDKIVVREARLLRRVDAWNERSARLFACDCAEDVRHLWGDDPRPAEAVRVARLFADGKVSTSGLQAAWDAARAAALDAAWDVARAAARDAAWAAAWDAAWAAAWKAQTCRLMDLLGFDSTHNTE